MFLEFSHRFDKWLAVFILRPPAYWKWSNWLGKLTQQQCSELQSKEHIIIQHKVSCSTVKVSLASLICINYL